MTLPSSEPRTSRDRSSSQRSVRTGDGRPVTSERREVDGSEAGGETRQTAMDRSNEDWGGGAEGVKLQVGITRGECAAGGGGGAR